MIRLSVNVNKVATLRNSRGGRSPSVLDAVGVCVDAGAPGITVHPRADRRHITPDDVRDDRGACCASARPASSSTSKAIRGRICSSWCEEVRPDQCTLVPVVPGEITSQAGWQPAPARERLPDVDRATCKARGIRVSLFVDAEPRADSLGGVGRRRSGRALHRAVRARVRARPRRGARVSFAQYAEAARLAHSLGLGVNAGHDLDLDNLALFRDLPHLDEVSIGHAIMSRALFVGLRPSSASTWTCSRRSDGLIVTQPIRSVIDRC